MVEVMGIGILEVIPKMGNIYLSTSTPNEFVDFILLINQIMSTFKVRASIFLLKGLVNLANWGF